VGKDRLQVSTSNGAPCFDSACYSWHALQKFCRALKSPHWIFLQKRFNQSFQHDSPARRVKARRTRRGKALIFIDHRYETPHSGHLYKAALQKQREIRAAGMPKHLTQNRFVILDGDPPPLSG
jgi:hypothetical protein